MKISLIFALSLFILGCNVKPSVKGPFIPYLLEDQKVILKVPYRNERTNYRKVHLPYADAESFSILNKIEFTRAPFGRGPALVWAQDSRQVYYGGIPLAGAKPNKLNILGSRYSKDENNVFYESNLLLNSDPNTFTIIGGPYSKDKNNVYYHDLTLPNANPKYFKAFIIDTFWNYAYSIDNKHLYFRGKLKQSCMPHSLTILDKSTGDWAKDSQCVYFKGEIIKNADSTSFQLVDNNYAKDKHSVFYRSQQIESANPATFRLEDNGFMATDEDRCYRLGKLVNCSTGWPIEKKKITKDELALKKINKGKSDLAKEFNRLLFTEEKNQKSSFLNLSEKLDLMREKYRKLSLFPKDVNNIDLSPLKTGTTYKIINRSMSKNNIMTIRLESIKSGIANFDIFIKNRLVKISEKRKITGEILSMPWGFYSKEATIYTDKKCQFKIGICVHKRNNNQNIKSEISFVNGVWINKSIYPGNQKERITYSIFDKFGFPLFISEVSNRKVVEEIERLPPYSFQL